jgi:hypothetical protein
VLQPLDEEDIAKFRVGHSIPERVAEPCYKPKVHGRLAYLTN